MSKVKGFLATHFSCDLRFLAMMRIFIGLSFLFDLIFRLGDLAAHYSDSGILPIEMARRMFPSNFMAPELKANPYLFSFHFIDGGVDFQLLLFLIMMALCVFLIVGYQTKWVSILLWVFCVSLHNRNILGFYPGDYLLRSTLLFGMFLPWGRCFSMDFLRKRQPISYRYFSVYGFGFLVFVGLFFIMAGFSKTGESWYDGTAVHYILIKNRLKTGWGDFLLDFPSLLAVLTVSTLWFEKIAPFFILSPWKNNLFRSTVLLLLAFMLLNFSIMLNIHLLPIIGMALCIGALPSKAWDVLFNRGGGDFIGFDNSAPLIYEGESPSSSSLLKFSQKSLFVLICVTILWTEWNRGARFGYGIEKVDLPAALETVAEVTRIKNPWRMFPDTRKISDGLLQIKGTDKQGKQWNVIEELEYSERVPEDFTQASGGFRWRRTLRLLGLTAWGQEQIQFQQQLAQFYCNQWEDKVRKNHSLEKVDFIVLHFPDYPPGGVAPPLERQEIGSYPCHPKAEQD